MKTNKIRTGRTASTRSGGFTLIELMIVVSIVAIISAIAYPSYQDSVRKSRRTDATGALLEAAAMQERIYSQSGSYVDNDQLARLVVNSDGQSSREGFYTLQVDLADCPTPPHDCFSITASATGAQTADLQCASFTLNHLGQKSSTPDANCW